MDRLYDIILKGAMDDVLTSSKSLENKINALIRTINRLDKIIEFENSWDKLAFEDLDKIF